MRWHRFTKRSYIWLALAMLLLFAFSVIWGFISGEGIGLNSPSQRFAVHLQR